MSPFQMSIEETRNHNRAAANLRIFGIKEHWASQHHYDLRLKYGNYLLSWAVPDGPSLYAGERRRAILMPDHDPEYLTSERIIPEGMPGAGAINLWDEGFWIASRGHEDISNCLEKGFLKFVLDTAKLHGEWVLQRIPNYLWRGRKEEWDLIKQADEFARARNTPDIRTTNPNSIKSGRAIDDPDVGKKKPVQNAQIPLFLLNGTK